MVKRILIFTDSRGQHKPAGQNHDIFGERLAKHPDLDVDLYLCPMKWTTTLDFFDQFSDEKLNAYDHVILYTGIVEWSPRPCDNALNYVYNNKNTANKDSVNLNTRDYSKKVVNNKKDMFDNLFGKKNVQAYLANAFGVFFEEQDTINMYSEEMASKFLLPKLASIPNLIFINSNRFVPNWNGDYKRGRPENISITENYSHLFSSYLNKHGITVIDLLSWDTLDVMRYTCDNLHLTEEGSDWIYDNLIKIINLGSTPKRSMINFQIPNYSFNGFSPIEKFTSKAKHDIVLSSAKCQSKYLATLIIGVRCGSSDTQRLGNLKFLLQWIDYYYSDLFDVLIVEQDEKPNLPLQDLDLKPYVRHCFLFNPEDYNRGWGYNVAIKEFCENSKVVALMDTDVLTGPNFVSDVRDCHLKIKVASPYLNIYYTDKEEAKLLKQKLDPTLLCDSKKIKNPVTVAGGIVIWNKSAYQSINGFEQYRGYSCEDRAMDVTIFNHFKPEHIRISPQTYLHLHHDSDQSARKNFKQIYDHLLVNYNCVYDKSLSPNDFIHKNCNHSDKLKTLELLSKRSSGFGDINLYSSGLPLTINGQYVDNGRIVRDSSVIFPPDFAGLRDYHLKEIYSQAPPADSDELSIFYNKFRGNRCFIIGNGPSLNTHDLSLLKNEYTFGVNSFYYKTRETGFTPTFYVVEDSSVMKENINEIRAYDAPYKFFPTIYKNLHEKMPNTFFFNMNRGFYEKSSPNYAVPRFSTDASKILYCGQSVTYINLQLAYYMGFTEVYLIGMDFDYVIPKSHKRSGDVLLSDTDDPNHFHKDYFGKGKTWKDPKLERVLMNYKMANLAYSAVGRKIFNATNGGKLEEFERVNYDQLLDSKDLKDSFANRNPSLSNIQGLSIAEANDHFRSYNFVEALNIYLMLYDRQPMEMYFNNACRSASRLGCVNDFSSIDELKTWYKNNYDL